MIEVFISQRGKVKQSSFEEIQQKKPRSIIWIDCSNPTKTELIQLQRYLKIQMSDLLIALDDSERARVEPGRYSMIIFRPPVFIKSQISTTTLGIFIKDNMVLSLHKDEIRTVSFIKTNPPKFMLNNGISFFVYILISRIIKRYDEILDQAEHQIDKIEEDILKKVEKNYMEETFSLKKTLIYFRKALRNNTEVIKAITQNQAFPVKEKNLYDDLYQDALQLVEVEEINRDRLKEILNVHLSEVSNNMNRIMKTFTVIASIVLVPSIITGYYGMNFENMPELKWAYGQYFALAIIFISVLILVTYFKKKKWL